MEARPPRALSHWGCAGPMPLEKTDFCVIAAVSNDRVFDACLARSPDVASGRVPVIVERGATSMARAYNAALARTEARICLLAHQDVYLPAGWLDRAMRALEALEADHPEWLVAGPHGVGLDRRQAGRTWDVAMGQELGEGGGFAPIAVASLDEHLLILNRADGYRFDEGLPSFHLYGTDMVQTAWTTGRSAWALDLPVVHNNRPVGSLSGGYMAAYAYTRRKWRDRLPIPTTICTLTRNPLPLWRARWRARRHPERPAHVPADSAAIARQAGYE